MCKWMDKGLLIPQVGKLVIIEHVKPDGQVIVLGKGTVLKKDPQKGLIEIRREIRAGGKYDGLGIPKEPGDYAITEFLEGSWSYRTAYYSKDNKFKGEYYNVNTPIEIHPDRVRYVDLEIDVVRVAAGEVTVIDEGLLLKDVAAGYITERLARQAQAVAASIVESLTGKTWSTKIAEKRVRIRLERSNVWFLKRKR